MRDELFRYYVDVGNSMYYYKHYMMRAKNKEKIYSGVLLLASAGGIGSMSLWEKIPTAWAVFLLIAQILQALQPLMPFAKRENALRYIVQDYEKIFNEIWEVWFVVYEHEMEPENQTEIKGKLLEWKRRECAAMDRFAPDLDFPLDKRASEKGREETRTYFWYNYSVEIEGEMQREAVK